MNLIFLGSPGSGKGTLAKLLSSALGVPHLSPGDRLREEVKQESELGKSAFPFMQKGELVPDEIILRMMEKRIKQTDCLKGFILDGFPRTRAQAEGLDELLSDLNRHVTRVVEFEVTDACAVRRLGGRRICSVCGADFNLYTKPPRKEGICDICGGKLLQRPDDQDEVIINRLRVYRKETLPLVQYYQDQGKLIRINGELEAELRLQEVLKALGVSGS
jgi:adenylate kinase